MTRIDVSDVMTRDVAPRGLRTSGKYQLGSAAPGSPPANEDGPPPKDVSSVQDTLASVHVH